MTETSALERERLLLAERLFSAMERLDPPQETVAWDDLSDDEKSFYRVCIMHLESEKAAWSRLLGLEVS